MFGFYSQRNDLLACSHIITIINFAVPLSTCSPRHFIIQDAANSWLTIIATDLPDFLAEKLPW
jgi:hypothetical protein